ncbi:MAG: branched-chain amino acid dehydrogenase [Anaerolineae bacterium]
MEIFEYMTEHNHERVVLFSDRAAGLRLIVAIHNTVLGPALGGARMWPYPGEEEALLDALRLSEGMTYKSSVAGLDFGGGKAVIIGDPHTDKTPALFRAFGRCVESLRGQYITGEDVGTTVADMAIAHQTCRYVVGLPAAEHGSGDPSPVTAFGVYQGMKACCRATFGSDSLVGRTAAIQGLGKVGFALAKLLSDEGATVIAAEIDYKRAAKAMFELGVKLVEPDDIFGVACDIFAPCALGAVINDETLDRLRCKIVAGAANNQLAHDQHGYELAERGILYAPDYVINAGGLINVATECGAHNCHEAWQKTAAIYDTVTRVLHLAHDEGVPTHLAAHRLAQARIEMALHAQAQPEAVGAV